MISKNAPKFADYLGIMRAHGRALSSLELAKAAGVKQQAAVRWLKGTGKKLGVIVVGTRYSRTGPPSQLFAPMKEELE